MLLNTNAILIIDDDAFQLEIYSSHLTARNYEVYSAKEGNEGLFLANKHRPALILVDWHIGYQNGLDICKILRKQPVLKDTAIAIITGKAITPEEIEDFNEIPDSWINKLQGVKKNIEQIQSWMDMFLDK